VSDRDDTMREAVTTALQKLSYSQQIRLCHRPTAEQAAERVLEASGLLARLAAVEAERDEAERALAEFVSLAEEARGHYGIEECSKPGQPETEWDEIQDGLALAAYRARAALAQLREGRDDG
jgi:hypothetical protein